MDFQIIAAAAVEGSALPSVVPFTSPPVGLSHTVTMTVADPCVVTITGTTYAGGTAIVFSTTGALPTGIAAGTTYYLGARSGATYKLYATEAAGVTGGTRDDLVTTGSQSGAHSCLITRNGIGESGKRAVIACSMAHQVRLIFAGTAAQNKDFSYQVSGVQKLSDKSIWMAEKIAAGVATLGNCALTAMTNGLVADTLTETTGSQYARAFSPANDAPASLTIDVTNFDFLVVDVTTSGASAAPTTMCVLAAQSTLPQSGNLPLNAAMDIGDVNLRNVAGTVINPATEDTLAVLTSAPAAKTLTGVIKAVTTAGTAVKLVAAETFARSVMLTAKRATTDNAGSVFIGVSDLDMGVKEYLELAPGDYWELPAHPGVKFDLSTIYIDADNATDGVAGIYMPV